MIILVDKRENKWHHIRRYFDEVGQPYEMKLLNFGDYSFSIDGKSFETDFVIETKRGNKKFGGGFAELENNLFNNKRPSKTGHSPKENFNIEFNKALNAGSEFVLLIENAESVKTILNMPNPVNQLRYRPSKLYYNSFLEFMERQNAKRTAKGLNKIQLVFSDNLNTGKLIIELCENYLKRMIIMKQTAEEILREYVDFKDVNGSETVEMLPLTIIDAMEEYAEQQVMHFY